MIVAVNSLAFTIIRQLFPEHFRITINLDGWGCEDVNSGHVPIVNMVENMALMRSSGKPSQAQERTSHII